MKTLVLAVFLCLLALTVNPEAALARELVKEPPPVAKTSFVLKAEPTAGTTKGLLRVEWVETEQDAEEMSRQGILRVFKTGQLQPIQQIPVELFAFRNQLHLEFEYIDRDDAQDFIFLTSVNGTGDSSEDVYRWDAQKEQFFRDERISGFGEVQVGKRGCLKVIGTCNGRTGYWEDAFCQDPAKQAWKRVGKPGRNSCR